MERTVSDDAVNNLPVVQAPVMGNAHRNLGSDAAARCIDLLAMSPELKSYNITDSLHCAIESCEFRVSDLIRVEIRVIATKP